MHVTPHAPQLLLSELVSMQLPLQSVSPEPQPALEHAPDEHTSPAAQAVPQLPQFAGSFVTSTHAPLQVTVPAGHTHEEPLQMVPLPHTVPQPPQFSGSLAVSTQPPAHASSPVGQLDAQVPRAQTSLAAHVTLQPPQ